MSKLSLLATLTSVVKGDRLYSSGVGIGELGLRIRTQKSFQRLWKCKPLKNRLKLKRCSYEITKNAKISMFNHSYGKL